MNIKLTNKDKIKVNDPEDIFAIMQKILLRDNKIDREKEHFWIVGMNPGGYIIFIELISLGSVNKTPVEPMNVFRVAILKGAVRVIAVHNHPSGTLMASDSDKDITDRLIQVGKIINIEVSDHLIITSSSYISFAEQELMEILRKSTTYVPTYQLIDTIRKEENEYRREIQKELKEKNEQLKVREREFEYHKINTIQNLLRKKIEIQEIAVILNLDVKEVEKIIKKKNFSK